MRTLIAYTTMFVMTMVLALPIVVLTMVGVTIPPDSFLGRAATHWSRAVLWATGVKVIVHNPHHIVPGESRIYMSNHLSWWEIFALASVLPRFRMVGKVEVRRIPIFGAAAGAVAAIYVDRKNRRTAFAAYEEAVPQIKSGMSVGVYPEGTRGFSYELRPFKKGPFVLAIAAQAPIVPVVSWGSLEIQKKGAVMIHPRPVELTFLEPIPTAGLNYDDRDALIERVWHAMADELEKKGVHSRGLTTEPAAT
jgi:1-acyl-sn-glycerol-3-phosphate acyltransferase